MTHAHAPLATADDAHARGRRLDDIGWALFFILTGVIWLLPEEQVPPGTWLIATGLLLLGLNAIRAAGHLPVSGFATVLGTLALAAGLGTLAGIDLPLMAIFLILLGVGLLARQLRRAEQEGPGESGWRGRFSATGVGEDS